MPYSVAIAGSTTYTLLCAQSLQADPRFQIAWVMTPQPKMIGRNQTLTPNPLYTWAEKCQIPVITIEQKIDQQVKQKLQEIINHQNNGSAQQTTSQVSEKPNSETSHLTDYEANKQTNNLISSRPDFLLVVDFGYYVPEWLIALPGTAALNIHPSLLPRWRGSSPGQFSLLNGESQSAITLMSLAAEMDGGGLYKQIFFDVGKDWTSSDYYRYSYQLMAPKLPKLMDEIATGESQPVDQFGPNSPTPATLPTPIARRLARPDGFIEIGELQSILGTSYHSTSLKTQSLELCTPGLDLPPTTPLLQNLLTHTEISNRPIILDRAIQALSPWPGVWTLTPDQKRVKILKSHLDVSTSKIELDLVQLEGKNPTRSLPSLVTG